MTTLNMTTATRATPFLQSLSPINSSKIYGFQNIPRRQLPICVIASVQDNDISAVQQSKFESKARTFDEAAELIFNESTLKGRRAMVQQVTAIAIAVTHGLFTAERAEARGAPAVTCTVSPTESGIEFCDSVIGTGETASKGMLIKAHYTGKLLDGTVFDTSYNRGKPLVFRVGVGEVIRGWDQGIIGTEGIPPMQAGGLRTLKIPAELAYGARGAGCRGGYCVIPPNSTLVFDVEFVGKA